MAIKATKISNAMTDEVRVLAGKLITAADGDGDYIVCELPKNAFIMECTVHVVTAYTAASTGTLTLGIKEPGVAINASQIAGDGTILSEATGYKVLHGFVHLPKGGIVTLGVTKGDSAANAVARVFVKYCVINL